MQTTNEENLTKKYHQKNEIPLMKFHFSQVNINEFVIFLKIQNFINYFL